MSKVHLVEKTARRDTEVVRSKLQEHLNTMFSRSGLNVSDVEIDGDGWIDVTVSDSTLFKSYIDRFAELPLISSEARRGIRTGRIGHEISASRIQVFLRHRQTSESVFLDSRELLRRLPTDTNTNIRDLIDTLCIEPLFPLQLFIGKKVMLSNHQVELFTGQIRRGLDGVLAWDVTWPELQETISESRVERSIAMIAPYGLLSYQLLIKLGMSPTPVETALRQSSEARLTEIRTKIYYVERASRLIHLDR